jgi:hypothetical protein
MLLSLTWQEDVRLSVGGQSDQVGLQLIHEADLAFRRQRSGALVVQDLQRREQLKVLVEDRLNVRL